MDESAIRLIQQTAIGDYNGKQERLAGTNTIALPNNFTLHNLEPSLPGRSRKRGTLNTDSIADFVSYVKAKATDSLRDGEPEGFIIAEDMAACVLFNVGFNAHELWGHADHRAMLELKRTAPYRSLLAINGSATDQRGLLDWIDDWAPHLQAYSDAPDQYKPLSEAIAAIRQVTITSKREQESTQEDFRGTRSTLEDVEAKSRVGLPGGFIFTCEPYLGLPEQSYRLRLSVLTGDEKPRLVLRVVRLEAEQEETVKRFKARLLEELADTLRMTIGTFKP